MLEDWSLELFVPCTRYDAQLNVSVNYKRSMDVITEVIYVRRYESGSVDNTESWAIHVQIGERSENNILGAFCLALYMLLSCVHIWFKILILGGLVHSHHHPRILCHTSICALENIIMQDKIQIHNVKIQHQLCNVNNRTRSIISNTKQVFKVKYPPPRNYSYKTTIFVMYMAARCISNINWCS